MQYRRRLRGLAAALKLMNLRHEYFHQSRRLTEDGINVLSPAAKKVY